MEHYTVQPKQKGLGQTHNNNLDDKRSSLFAGSISEKDKVYKIDNRMYLTLSAFLLIEYQSDLINSLWIIIFLHLGFWGTLTK